MTLMLDRLPRTLGTDLQEDPLNEEMGVCLARWERTSSLTERDHYVRCYLLKTKFAVARGPAAE